MSESIDECVPALVSMFRFQWEPAQSAHVLLYPEGMVKLSNSAGEILKRVDSRRTIRTIIDELKALAGVDLDNDVRNFLLQARENGWITF